MHTCANNMARYLSSLFKFFPFWNHSPQLIWAQRCKEKPQHSTVKSGRTVTWPFMLCSPQTRQPLPDNVINLQMNWNRFVTRLSDTRRWSGFCPTPQKRFMLEGDHYHRTNLSSSWARGVWQQTRAAFPAVKFSYCKQPRLLTLY